MIQPTSAMVADMWRISAGAGQHGICQRVFCSLLAPILTISAFTVWLLSLEMFAAQRQCMATRNNAAITSGRLYSSRPSCQKHTNLQPLRFHAAEPHYPGGDAQVPWDEGLVSANGEVLLARTINYVKGSGLRRFAFYMHYWDPQLPLRWTYGELSCPAPQPTPVCLCDNRGSIAVNQLRFLLLRLGLTTNRAVLVNARLVKIPSTWHRF
jgi:hypothetical protein